MDKKKIYYNIPTNSKIVGRKINKTRLGNSKIFKNLSQFPIEIHLQGKQNQSIGAINRPHSSINQQEQPHKNLRIESAASHYTDHNKKRLSLDSTNKKHQRDSLMSRNSLSKKVSKNQIGMDQASKAKLAEDRRRYNNSCGSAIQQRSKHQAKKKLSQKPKRLSINNLHLAKKDGEKSQNNRIKQEKSLIIRDKTDKSKSKSKNKKKKKQSTIQFDKSKASTTAIGFGNCNKNDKKFLKKKQSLSTAAINLPQKQKKKKATKKVSQKIEIVDQFSQEQYPINKYETEGISKKNTIHRPSLKPKSKSRKGSTSKQRHKKTYSLIEEIQYASCINIPSNSSGLINSLSHSSHQSSKIKIIDNWQFRYFGQQNPTSVNLQEIRYYQSNAQSKKKHQRQFINNKFGNKSLYKKRKDIEVQISEQYPNFSQLQLKFLSSVVFIQRKWREFRLYKQIFSNFSAQNNERLPLFFQKSNSKQLNISNGPKSAEKPISKNTTQVQSAQTAGFIQTTPFSTQNKKQITGRQIIYQSERIKEQSNESENKFHNIKNDMCIQEQIEKSHKNERLFFNQKRQQNERGKRLEQQRKSNSSKEFSLKSQRYQFLQSQVFPNITYILLKKQQLKEQLLKKLHDINQLHQNEALLYDEYIKIKGQYEKQYERKLKQLNKSKQDIKKGYLKFIDTYKDIKHQALRKVSSESGLMANMYKKIFHFDQNISIPSDSSESLKKLTNKILIRKQFYHTQKIQPFIYNTSQLSENNTLSQRLHQNVHQQIVDLSARCFKSRREKVRQQNQNLRKKDLYLEIESSSNKKLDRKRIKEGINISPQLQKETHTKNLTLSFSKSDELLPLTILSPKQQQHFQQNYPKNYERKERIILEQIVALLTHQLYTELVKIDQKRDDLNNFAFEEKIRHHGHHGHHGHLQIIDQNQSSSEKQEKSEESLIVEEQKLRQIYKIEGLQEKKNQLGVRKHRNSNEFNISPASSQKIAFGSEDILLYTESFFAYLSKNQLVGDIIIKLNKNQGFTPLEYLKFLRDFEIPDDQYDPLINNQTFIDWEDYFYNKYYPTSLQENEETFVIRQSITIFHRCIFQSIIFLFEEYRPCGEKGIPFPWEKTPYFDRTVTRTTMDRIFNECLGKLDGILKINCGIIDQKYTIYNQQDLERIHQQNQDKIINMLQKELGESPHNWYQVEQHSLQIKLELQCQIMQYLMLQALDQILENY